MTRSRVCMLWEICACAGDGGVDEVVLLALLGVFECFISKSKLWRASVSIRRKRDLDL